MKFSVSMCVYGGDNDKYFREALESVYQQTRKPDEVILTVDGPVSQKINNVIYDYKNKYGIKVFRLEKNSGHGIARRVCLSHCSYEYVAIVDADDINVPERFEKQLKCFEKDKTLSAISTACYHFAQTKDNIINEEKLPETDAEIKKTLKRRCPLCHASTMFRKSIVEKSGGYLDWYYAEDYYLWVRMFLNGASFYNLQESLLYVRTDQEQIARRGGYRYYKSLYNLFGFMRKNHIIDWDDYIYNIVSRFILQVLMPGKIRAFVRKYYL